MFNANAACASLLQADSDLGGEESPEKLGTPPLRKHRHFPSSIVMDRATFKPSAFIVRVKKKLKTLAVQCLFSGGRRKHPIPVSSHSAEG